MVLCQITTMLLYMYFTCKSNCLGVTSYMYFDGKLLKLRSLHAHVVVRQVLEVHDAVPSNAGVIEVVATNPYGQVSCSSNLQVQGE